jgi:hypothetical protein
VEPKQGGCETLDQRSSGSHEQQGWESFFFFFSFIFIFFFLLILFFLHFFFFLLCRTNGSVSRLGSHVPDQTKGQDGCDQAGAGIHKESPEISSRSVHAHQVHRQGA